MIALLGLLVAGASAQDDPTCPPDSEYLAGAQFLRALSLDLRGVAPEVSDYDLLDATGEVPDAVIDAWLDTPDFAAQVVRHHRDLLWNNVTNQSLIGTPSMLSVNVDIYYKRNSTLPYRGKQDQTCGTAPATFGPDGEPVVTFDAEGDVQEGYVWVSPYWAPDTQVKVCAYDARAVETSPIGLDCGAAEAYLDPGCGCGPELRWCGHYGTEGSTVLEAMGTDVDNRVEAMINNDRSYLELLTGKTGFVNGPLSYFLRYQTGVPGAIRFTEAPIDVSVLPDLAFTDVDTWVEVPLGDQHSGVFTSPAYLLRFMTNRARANRFWNDFLCQPFVAPEGGLPDVADAAATLDLSERAGCNYCHALLEPAAAYWGRWSPSGAAWLDPAEFEPYDADCAVCGESGASCPDVCVRYYVTDVLSEEESPFVGWMKAYEFLSPGLELHVEQGPELLVETGIADGRLPRCVATRTAGWLLGRPLTSADDAWVDSLATTFTTSNFDYKALVRAVVSSDDYRRVQ